ncbi:MAG: chorismate mutase, partial [Rhodospirillaceae bacterium]|nr:chorismate mutase [Rhodospirillaceae bacterium]
MSQGAGAIEDLRREIDAIDTALHDLLIRRSEIAAEIGALKADAAGARPNGRAAAFMRPGREAVILRRLVERHRGPLPWGTIVRIWRELMSAALRVQGPFAVAVCEPDGAAGGYWDLTRDHFGAHTPTTAHATAEEVLRAVAEGRAGAGVLPVPRTGEPRPWWPRLADADAATPRVCARLPFGTPGVTRGGPVEALVVARVPPEAPGEDRSLV